MITYFSRKARLKTCEDSLTATVFDGLKYLPTELFWRILKKSLCHDKLPCACGEMISMSFWDHWDSKDTGNKKIVEPDIFIQFKEFDIIIEAKRSDEHQQSREQIEKEIVAYSNEYGKEGKAVYFLQLGGLSNQDDEKDFTNEENKLRVIICKTNWTRILDVIVSERKELKRHNLSTSMAYARIMDDIIKGMELHQFYKKNWLSDLSLNSYQKEYSFEKIFDYAKRRRQDYPEGKGRASSVSRYYFKSKRSISLSIPVPTADIRFNELYWGFVES